MEYSKLSFIDRMLAQAVEKSTNAGEGEYRDRAKVRGWAQILLS